MQFGVDPGAFAVALVAIWFTYRESRRNNSVVPRVTKCEFTEVQSVKENGGQLFRQFSLHIRNQGISLHDPAMAINFRGRNGTGLFSCPLKRRSKGSNGSTEFAKGMVSEFGFKSYELNEVDKQLLGTLQDPSEQHAYLCIYSQGYLAKEIRVGGLCDRLKTRWNRFASAANCRFERETGKNSEGIPIVKYLTILPMFTVFAPHIMDFIHSLAAGSEWGRT